MRHAQCRTAGIFGPFPVLTWAPHWPIYLVPTCCADTWPHPIRILHQSFVFARGNCIFAGSNSRLHNFIIIIAGFVKIPVKTYASCFLYHCTYFSLFLPKPSTPKTKPALAKIINSEPHRQANSSSFFHLLPLGWWSTSKFKSALPSPTTRMMPVGIDPT